MHVKMLENFQGRGVTALSLPDKTKVSVLAKGNEYEVSVELAAWLLEHGKAQEVKGKHYGAQKEPELRADDEKYEEVKAEAEPMMTTQNQGAVVKPEADATEAAVKLAEENGVDLADVEGTGSGGRVILSDVQDYIEG